MYFIVIPSRFNQITGFGRSSEDSIGTEPYVVAEGIIGIKYFWPNDQLPANWPTDSVGKYLYDGTTFTLKSENNGYQGLLFSERLSSFLIRRGYSERNTDIDRVIDHVGHSRLSREAERRISEGYGGYTGVHELHRRQLYEFHNDPTVRARIKAGDSERNRLALRYEEILAALSALDPLNADHRELGSQLIGIDLDDPNNLWKQDIIWNSANLLLPTLPVDQDGNPRSSWPTYTISEEQLKLWHGNITAFDVDQAAEAELRELFGGSLGVAIMGSITGNYGRIGDAVAVNVLVLMIDRRRKEIRVLDPLPTDPTDPNLWGHDVRAVATAGHVADGADRKPSTTIEGNILELPAGYEQNVIVTAVDPRATTADNDDGSFTVTAEDRTTTATYTVRTASTT